MKAKKLKSGRKVLMPTFTRRLKSFKLREVKVDNPYTFHIGILGFVKQMNRLTILIEGAQAEKKPP
jgi:uncharacterized protein YkuJ